MPPPLLFLLLPAIFWAAVNANVNAHNDLHRDFYSYPKYRVAFLKDLPLENQTAFRWLSDGLKGGQQEFLGQWHQHPHHPKEIESGTASKNSKIPVTSDHQSDEQQERVSNPSSNSPPLELLRLGQRSYLCLIPPPPPLPQESSLAEDQSPITPTHSWSLLQPLSGSCLYHRQAWFTYSYCHNVHVRQFRELSVTNRQDTGERIVEEDPEWESYTLGRSPLASEATENILHDELAIANNLELAHHQTAGQRYLVQRWSDGTLCDKTGGPREVEIQFHCSMTMTDTIIFVKETRTCEYVLVINTPRLCGEPGFKSHFEQVPEAEIQCRQVLNDDESLDEEQELDNMKHPFRRIPRPPIIPPTKTGEQGKKSGGEGATDAQVLILKTLEQLIRKSLDLTGSEHADVDSMTEAEGDSDSSGDDIIFIALDPESGEGEQQGVAYKDRIAELLRKIRYQVESEEAPSNEEDDEKKHDEL